MDFLFNDNASHTSLLPMGLEKTTCERQILALCQQLHTKHYIKRYKQQVYKTTIVICFNLRQVFPPVPPVVFAVCFIPFLTFWGPIIHVSLNLMAVLTV